MLAIDRRPISIEMRKLTWKESNSDQAERQGFIKEERNEAVGHDGILALISTSWRQG